MRTTIVFLVIRLLFASVIHAEEASLDKNGIVKEDPALKTVSLVEYEAVLEEVPALRKERDDLLSQLDASTRKQDKISQEHNERMRDMEDQFTSFRKLSDQASIECEKACIERVNAEGKAALVRAVNGLENEILIVRKNYHKDSQKSKEEIKRLEDELLDVKNKYYNIRREYFKTLHAMRTTAEREENRLTNRLWRGVKFIGVTAFEYAENYLSIDLRDLIYKKPQAFIHRSTDKAGSILFSSASQASRSLDSFLAPASTLDDFENRSAFIAWLDGGIRQATTIICAYCQIEKETAVTRWIYARSKFVHEHSREVINWVEFLTLVSFLIWIVRLSKSILTIVTKGSGRSERAK